MLLREFKPFGLEGYSRNLLQEKILRPNRVLRVGTISIDLRHRYTVLAKERESSGLACGSEILWYGDMIGNLRDHLEAVLKLEREDAIEATLGDLEYIFDLSMFFAQRNFSCRAEGLDVELYMALVESKILVEEKAPRRVGE